MSTTPARAPVASEGRPDPRPLLLSCPDDVDEVVALLSTGTPVGHGFANLYAISAHPDAAAVRRVNVLKGRPPQQVGSLTCPRDRIAEQWEWSRLPARLAPDVVLAAMDDLLRLGPFGFRGPAADHVPLHLTQPDDGVLTAQVILPGHTCRSNAFLAAATQRLGTSHLYITSANRSRHATGADDSPAHWRADALRRDFPDADELPVLAHDDDLSALERYPWHRATSTSILSFHRDVGGRRPTLLLERHGSLAADVVRQVLDRLGLGLEIGPRARTRLVPRP